MSTELMCTLLCFFYSIQVPGNSFQKKEALLFGVGCTVEVKNDLTAVDRSVVALSA